MSGIISEESNFHNQKNKNPPFFSPKTHSFNVGVATQTKNVNAAIIFNHIFFWLEENKIKGKHQIDGRTWMYDTIATISSYFSYLSFKQVRKALEDLVEHGYLVEYYHHEDKRDRTKWYALSNEDWIDSKSNSHLPYRANGGALEGKCIYKDTHITTTHKTNIVEGAKNSLASKRLAPVILDSENRKFLNISEDDKKAWKEKFPNLDIERQLALCAEWAVSEPRKNYRKSILAWLNNNSKEGQQMASTADSDKALAEKVHALFKKLRRNDFELGYKYVDFKNGMQTAYLEFGDKDFKLKVMEQLRKRNLRLEDL